MLNRLLTSLYRRWGVRTLSAKLLLPSLALILLSLVGTSAAFLGGTRLTRSRLLEQQTREEFDHVARTLSQRQQAVSDAGSLLAGDPDVVDAVQQETEAALSMLNSRAVVVRDRFDLALVQVYDQHDLERASLMLSNVASPDTAVFSLLDLSESGTPVARVVGDRLLLLCRFPILEGAGTVLVGIDLETELQRILAQDCLASDLRLTIRGVQVGTCTRCDPVAGDLSLGNTPLGAFEPGDGWMDDHYGRKGLITLGSTPAELILVRPTEDIEWVTTTGLVVTIGGVLLTVLLLSGLNVMVIRSIGYPVASLSRAAKRVAKGELAARVELTPHPLTIGDCDEIGLLAEAFNEMTDDLLDLCANLEAKVGARTAELATAAEVARAVSSSLDLQAILRESSCVIKRRLEDVCPGVHHVGIYLAEAGHRVVVLQEAASDADENLRGANVRVALGTRSPVGRAASTKRPEVVQNVRVVGAHLKPPLLLDTNSAAAAPLLMGGRLIGALSVESTQPHAFSANSLQLLVTLADQIAIGVHNAHLYEQQRRATEQCVDLDRTRSQFLTAMSKQLRIPLNTVKRVSGRLLEHTDGRLTHTQEADLRLIHESGERLLALIDDLLYVSQLGAGGIDPDFRTVDVRQVIESAVGAVTPLLEGTKTTLRTDLHSVPSTIRADERQLRQIVLSLLSAAASFAAAGSLEVRARTVEALNADTGCLETFLEVTVAYTGEAGVQRKLLSVFRAVAQPDQAGVGGEWSEGGLRPPLVKGLVERQGGRIWAEAAEGKGTTCTLILPVRPLDGRLVHACNKPTMIGDEREAVTDG